MKIFVNIVRVTLLLIAIFFTAVLFLCIIHFLVNGESHDINKILLRDLSIVSAIAIVAWAIARSAYKAL